MTYLFLSPGSSTGSSGQVIISKWCCLASISWIALLLSAGLSCLYQLGYLVADRCGMLFHSRCELGALGIQFSQLQSIPERTIMAKNKNAFEKQRKEMERMRKAKEKRERRHARRSNPDQEEQSDQPDQEDQQDQENQPESPETVPTVEEAE